MSIILARLVLQLLERVLEAFWEEVCSAEGFDSDLLSVKTIISPEFSGFFLNEFEDRVYLFSRPVEVLSGECVEGKCLDSVFEAPVQYFFSHLRANSVSIVWPE